MSSERISPTWRTNRCGVLRAVVGVGVDVSCALGMFCCRTQELAAFGMAVAVIATLFQNRIISYEWIVVGAAVGAIAGPLCALFR